MKLPSLLSLVILCVFAAALPASAGPFPVVTSMSTFQEIVRDIGGNAVEIRNIGPHDQDIHFVIVKPSHVQFLMDAKMLVHTGLMGEPWLAALLESASNRHLFPGNPGDCDASVNIKILEKPENLSREMGDVHPGGNSHFWLDPVNIITAGANVRDKLTTLLPEQKATFEKNFQEFAERWKKRTLDWAKRLAALGPIRVIDYHVSWSYLYERFKLERVATIEPKPGIKPSGAHLAKVIADGKAKKVDFLLAEPFFPQRDIAMVAKELGVPSLIIQQSPGGAFPRQEDIFEAIVAFAEKLKKGKQ
jgi:zinc/manganese transport system substrate-binding protein